MKLSLITVNYNGSANTAKLLNSLRDSSAHDFEMIVVDNASSPEDRASLESHVRADHPFARLIKNDRNLGFSGGNNTGIRFALESGADWVVLINNDTEAETGFISRLRADLSQREGVVGIPLREGSRTAYCGRIMWLKPTLPHVYETTDNKPLTTDNNAYAIGGGMAVHRTVFKKIGLLDDCYFLYFEDADFCRRARKSGIPIGFIRDTSIRHAVSASAGRLGAPLLLRYHYRNAHLFNFKNGPWYVKIALPFWSFFVIFKQLAKVIFMPLRRVASRAILMGVVDFYRNKTGQIIQ